MDDWEVLSNSDDSTSVENTSYLEGIERESEGIIRSDYFSIDSHHNNNNSYAPNHVEDDISVASDNPSWIDPVSDTRYTTTKPPPEFWSSDGSDDGKYIESEASNNELGFVEAETRQSEIESDSGEIEDSGEESDRSGELEVVEARDQVADGGEEEERKNKVAVWWKLPLDLLKYCVFRASPVWTLSVAAAMMGVVILGRRLYKMKQKNRSLQLKVTIDDKKVSQFMSRAARLNEAFSVVKRGPMIRPSLPANGISPWPMMALR